MTKLMPAESSLPSTEAGLARLADTAPVHLRGVVELFVSQLTDEELALLKSALDKVTVECTFGS